MAFTVRPVRADDGPVLADLHVRSWRSAYRGILSDAFLDNDVVEERRTVWSARMVEWNPARSFAEIAEIDGMPGGFVCVMRDIGPEHGVLLDNLHVLPERRGGGIGRRLLVDAARWVADRCPGSPMYLTVYFANENARAFYGRMGGIASEPYDEREHDGRTHRVLRFIWPKPEAVR